MLDHQAENCFRRGLELLDRGRHRDAVPLFRNALELHRESSAHGPVEARYLSYYGLTLCASHEWHEAVRCCREAVRVEGYRPELWWNLGRVALASGRRAEAYRSLHHALSLQPGHRGILRELRRMGLRSRPPLRFLPRQHPVNVFLGRLRSGKRPTARRSRSPQSALAADPG